MPFCRNCGAEINEKAYVCIHCGVKVFEEPIKEEKNDSSITLGILGLCFVWFPLATWIISGIGLGSAYKNDNTKGKRLNLIALIVTSSLFVLGLLIQFSQSL